MTVIALLSPLLPTAAGIHALLDHDHAGEPRGRDADVGLHGHSHPSGTPAHEHGSTAPALGTCVARERDATTFVLSSSVAPLPIVTCALDPPGCSHAVARGSPAIPRASVLRI